jgi:hypothetical protein
VQDPYGYIEGAELGENQMALKLSGDMIATFMGWLEDTEAGGGTAFLGHDQELLVATSLRTIYTKIVFSL